MTTDQKLQKVKGILNLVDESLSRKDFITSFENVVKQVKIIEARQELKIRQIEEENKKLRQRIESENKSLKTKTTDFIKAKIDDAFEMIKSKIKDIDNRLSKVKDGKDGKDGKDANEDRVADIVAKKIDIPKIEDLANEMPKLGERVRDSLELLEGDDRLEIDAIKDLKEKLEEIEERAMRFGGKGGSGGGLSKFAMDLHFIEDETPTGTINGSNKVFTLNLAPNPITSLKVYRGGARQKITEDYTLSGNTITFNIAPVSGEIITCDYRA